MFELDSSIGENIKSWSWPWFAPRMRRGLGYKVDAGFEGDSTYHWYELSSCIHLQMHAVRAKIGDRATSDVVVRLRTQEGRDHWFYCHSEVLSEKSTYFADRLSNDWPTCQILDSRYCVEVHCEESEYNSYVNALRLLYVNEPYSWYGVRSTLGILRAASHLGCHRMAGDCMNYLESVPWDEADEEEILRTVPGLGSQYECIMARLRPINPVTIDSIFVPAFGHATASPKESTRELKSSAQEQIEYMLTEDDDAPLLAFDDDFTKSKVKNCITELLARFSDFTESLAAKSTGIPLAANVQQELHTFLSDISWACRILSKVEMLKDLVHYWITESSKIRAAVELVSTLFDILETRLKVVEVTARVLESIAFANFVLPADRRRHVVSVWIGFVQRTKPLIEQSDLDDGQVPKFTLDNEIWQGLESAIVSIVLTLPSDWQAEILTEWIQSKHVRYPDLTEAFEVWCYRSKVARRRLSILHCINRTDS